MIFSPIFGYYGDRSSRKRLMVIGILFWCCFTVLGSFSQVCGLAVLDSFLLTTPLCLTSYALVVSG
jgi:MFS family permease